MGDLYGVRILEVDPEARRVRIEVIARSFDDVYAIYKPLPSPENPTFFLSALHDGGASWASRPPLRSAVELAQILDERWMHENAARFVTKVERIDVKNLLSGEDERAAFVARLNDLGNEPRDADYPQATYDVFLADGAYLSHLRAGARYGTSAYEIRAT